MALLMGTLAVKNGLSYPRLGPNEDADGLGKR
jgi:hypothetical protein